MRKTKNQSCHKNLGATILIKMEKSQKKGQKKVLQEKVKDHACFEGLQTFQDRACKYDQLLKFFTDQTKKYPIQEV